MIALITIFKYLRKSEYYNKSKYNILTDINSFNNSD